MIRAGQFSNLSEMPTLSVSVRQIQSKLDKLCWWQRQTEAFIGNQGGRNSKINDSICPSLGLVRDLIHFHLQDLIKTEGIMVITSIFPL